MSRQRCTGVFVTGTDTGVGKSIVSGGLAALLHDKGIDVGVMKPAETGCLRDDGSLHAADAEYLRALAGVSDSIEEIVPYRFQEPLAPAVAARLERVSIDVDHVVRTFAGLARRHEFMIVEGAGGLLVPFAGTVLIVDLIKRLGLPILIVARGNLGTINHTLMTVACAKAADIAVAGIVINNVVDDDSRATRTNPDVIASLTAVPIWGTLPFRPDLTAEATKRDEIVALAARYLDWSKIQQVIEQKR